MSHPPPSSALQMVDVNVHLVPADGSAHPRALTWPSDWPPGSGLSIDEYRRHMTRAGIGKAVLVTAIREHGFDNTYTYDSWSRYEDDFVWVGNVDVTAPHAVRHLRWLVGDCAMAGARLVVGTDEDPTAWLADDRSRTVLDAVAELGVPASIQKFSVQTVTQLAAVANRYPSIPFVLYSLGNPSFRVDRWQAESQALTQVARQQNIAVALSPHNLAAIDKLEARGRAATLAQLAGMFPPHRLMWGSFSLFRGARAPLEGATLFELVQQAQRAGSVMGPSYPEMLLGGTATRLYPALER